jgi:hypothetical protein
MISSAGDIILEEKMRIGLIGLALAAGMAVFATQASAAPIAPLGDDGGKIVLVAGGCGPGWHRGPFGGCRPNFRGPRCYWVRGPYGRAHRVCR